jgi:hypothetical protein
MKTICKHNTPSDLCGLCNPPMHGRPSVPASGSVTAVEIVSALLENPYPHDLMEIRRAVNTYTSEMSAMADLETYCTGAFALKARAHWQAAQDAAREWLSSQHAKDQAQPDNQNQPSNT